jgi:hypothetical protein
MKIFGFRIITDEEYQELRKSYNVHARVGQCYRWLSGWKDLDIIWDYLLMKDDFYCGGIERCRTDYAKARGTDVYGKTEAKNEQGQNQKSNRSEHSEVSELPPIRA